MSNFDFNSFPPNTNNNLFISNQETSNALTNAHVTRSIGESNLYSQSTKRVNSGHNRPMPNNCKTDGQETQFRSNRRDDDEDKSGGNGRYGRTYNAANQFNFNNPNQNTTDMRNWNSGNQNAGNNNNGGGYKKNDDDDFLMENDDTVDNRNNLKSTYIVEVPDEFVDADLSMYNEVFVEDDYDRNLNQDDLRGQFLISNDQSDGEIDYERCKNESNLGNGLKRTTNFTNYKANLITIEESKEHAQELSREYESSESSSSIVDLNFSHNEIEFRVESDNEKESPDLMKKNLKNLESENASAIDEKKNLENVERQRGKLKKSNLKDIFRSLDLYFGLPSA